MPQIILDYNKEGLDESEALPDYKRLKLDADADILLGPEEPTEEIPTNRILQNLWHSTQDYYKSYDRKNVK